MTIVLLEIGLRIAGAVVLFLQEKHNHLSISSSEYRVLCLGESTTALGGEDSYPSQLERLLNNQSKQKFSVINKGIVGTVTEEILARADHNLNTYHPDLVIVMMGINDRFYYKDYRCPPWIWRASLFVQSFRVYKLIDLISQHLSHYRKKIVINYDPSEDLKEQENYQYQKTEKFLQALIARFLDGVQTHLANADRFKMNHQSTQYDYEMRQANSAAIGVSSGYVDLANRYRQQGLYKEAQDCLQKAVKFDPNSEDVYYQWGQVYLAMANGQGAIEAFNKAMELNPKNKECLLGMARGFYLKRDDRAMVFYLQYLKENPKDYWGFIELAQWFKEMKIYDQAEASLKQAIDINSGLDRAYLDLGLLLEEQGRIKEQGALYLQRISKDPRNSRMYQELALYYQKQGRNDLAKGSLKNAVKYGLAQYKIETLLNFDSLLKKILDRGIPVIVMQYPLRSIEPLKGYLGSRKGLYYVENKQNFKELMRGGEYALYFRDSFGDDFGHCTRRGNELIARNLVGPILEISQGSLR